LSIDKIASFDNFPSVVNEIPWFNSLCSSLFHQKS